MNYFVTTRLPNNIYDIFVNSCKKDSEKKLKKSLKIFDIEKKHVHISDAGQGLDKSKETLVFLHGSGMSHIVWSLAEHFFSSKNFTFK
mgnify:CR=1 FL=1